MKNMPNCCGDHRAKLKKTGTTFVFYKQTVIKKVKKPSPSTVQTKLNNHEATFAMFDIINPNFTKK
jgi:hypothetical protein